MEYKDEQGVPYNIDNVHDDGRLHGYLGISHGAEQGGAGIIHGQEGVGQCGYGQVNQGIGHHIPGHAAVEQMQHPPAKQDAEHHYNK